MSKCQDCGSESENDLSACAGACAEERDQGVPDILIGPGLPICNCCDDCRIKCHDSWMEENTYK